MNSVCIIGFLRERIDDFYRYFEYELPFLQETNKTTPIIVLRNWTGQSGARINVLEKNTRVAIHGHLDAHEKFGTILVVEELQTLK